MIAEIREQPAMLAALAGRAPEIKKVADVVAARKPRFALLAARGSSDHAALYAKYLIEVLLQLPAGLVSPSTTTLYGARPELHHQPLSLRKRGVQLHRDADPAAFAHQHAARPRHALKPRRSSGFE